MPVIAMLVPLLRKKRTAGGTEGDWGGLVRASAESFVLIGSPWNIQMLPMYETFRA
jgi:hypothetical protein